MQEDREIHHVSYWHRDHQWPGTWMCLKHRTALLRGIGKVNTHGRFHWYLPEEMTLVPPGVPATLEAATATLTKVAECAVALGCGTKQEWLEPVRVQQTYRWRLAELGVLRGSDQIDAKDLQTILTSSLLPLSPIFGFETLAEDQTSLTTQFLRLFRSTRSVGQPAVFAWLYRNDRAWLVSFAQTLPRLQRSNNVCIRWDTRDVQLAQSVRQVADAFASSHDQTRPRLADLCDAIEALRRRLGHLDRMPLTRAAIREVVRGRFSG